jgi:hydrogenase maturation protein HypF
VVRIVAGKERVLRRSRGYTPVPIELGAPTAEVLACGGELKNVFCLTKKRYAILSQHIGDLENLETMQAFEQTLGDMRRFFRVSPRAVAYDLHPHYLSTRYALALEGVEKIGVQHHFAHIASCMADNRLDGPVIGVAFDGTGYGTDGKIWGGEILVCDFTGFERAAHFRYTSLAGGDTAVRQGWRSALAYLRDAGVDPFSVLHGVPSRSVEIVDKMIAAGINTVDCCSCGRLFDAVAAILGIRTESNYEGQAAMQLEAVAERTEEAYPFDFDGKEIDFRPAIRALVNEARQPALAASRFHSTVANATVGVCEKLRTQTGLTRVCLSGGAFQNALLAELSVERLRRHGFEVFLHSRVPTNDGGLSLGQAMIAARKLG